MGSKYIKGSATLYRVTRLRLCSSPSQKIHLFPAWSQTHRHAHCGCQCSSCWPPRLCDAGALPHPMYTFYHEPLWRITVENQWLHAWIIEVYTFFQSSHSSVNSKAAVANEKTANRCMRFFMSLIAWCVWAEKANSGRRNLTRGSCRLRMRTRKQRIADRWSCVHVYTTVLVSQHIKILWYRLIMVIITSNINI